MLVYPHLEYVGGFNQASKMLIMDYGLCFNNQWMLTYYELCTVFPAYDMSNDI